MSSFDLMPEPDPMDAPWPERLTPGRPLPWQQRRPATVAVVVDATPTLPPPGARYAGPPAVPQSLKTIRPRTITPFMAELAERAMVPEEDVLRPYEEDEVAWFDDAEAGASRGLDVGLILAAMGTLLAGFGVAVGLIALVLVV